MSSSDYKVERVGFALILCIALLMFFQPLVRLHGPTGSQIGNAFSVRYKLSQFQSNLRMMATVKYSADSGGSLVPVAAAPTAGTTLAIPFSLRMVPLVPWFVFASLGLCLLALLDHLSFQKAVAILSLVAGCAGAIAILHLTLMSSDLRSWTEILMTTALINSPEDPSGLIMMDSSIFISPGFGLYVLTTCLLLLPLLSFTRAVPRARSVVRHEQRVGVSQPIEVRPVNSRYPGEICTSLDASEGGLLLESSLNHYYVGMELYLTRKGLAGSPGNPAEHGSVVRVQKMQSGKCRFAIRVIPEV